MTQPRPAFTFDPQSTHDLAAHMYWLLAEEIGVPQAQGRVLETQGQCLLEHRFDKWLFEKFPIGSLSPDDRGAMLQAVAAEATDFAQSEQNMLGSIYVEDMAPGRSPLARGIDTDQVRFIPRCRYNQPLERIGSLCIRHPLPAIVFSPTAPTMGVIEVADTTAALGFQLPMFLVLAGMQQVQDDLFVLAGYFYVPAPSEEIGDRWSRIIQNSIRTIGQVMFTGLNGTTTIEYEWGDATSRKRWWKPWQ